MSPTWHATAPQAQTEASALLTDREVSALTNVRLDTLKYLWLTGKGPEYIEEGGCIRCTLASVLKWQAERRAAHARLVASYRGPSRG